MELRNLGASGLRVSAVGLGCNNFGGRIGFQPSQAVIHQALDSGITLFDTADIYGNAGGSEEILGKVLGDRRKDVVLATKFGMQMGEDSRKKGASRRYIMLEVDESLRRLKTDWIDLYQLHQVDPLTPLEETLAALDDLVRQGKVRYIGCSNLPAWMVADSLWISATKAWEKFITCQDEYSLLVRGIERELIPFIQSKGIGLLPYFPLASGLLTGKYEGGKLPDGARITGSEGLRNRLMTQENLAIVGQLHSFAEERGHSLLELAFGWLLCKPYIPSVIAGATKPEQITANIAAASWRLTSEEMDAVDEITAATR